MLTVHADTGGRLGCSCSFNLSRVEARNRNDITRDRQSRKLSKSVLRSHPEQDEHLRPSQYDKQSVVMVKSSI